MNERPVSIKAKRQQREFEREVRRLLDEKTAERIIRWRFTRQVAAVMAIVFFMGILLVWALA